MTERTANQALDDYNARLYSEKQEWAKKLAKPANRPTPTKKPAFFSLFFRG